MTVVDSRLSHSVQTLLDEVVTDLVKWDLLVFLHANQDVWSTPETISKRCGRPLNEVEAGLEALVLAGVAERRLRHNGAYYCYTGSERGESVEEFVKLMNDRDMRLAILTYILDKMEEA